MARKITLTPSQKAREDRLNAFLNGESKDAVPPISLKPTHIPDNNAEREARAEAKAS